MKRSAKQLASAFCIAAILIGMVGGFLVVDLHLDRFLSEDQGSFFRISSVDSEGFRLDLMGERYQIKADSLTPFREAIWEYRGLLPRGVQAAGIATVRGFQQAYALWESAHEPEVREPW